MPSIALKFIAGKYQGGEFPLPETGEVIVGRASEAEMVLVEDMVSRRHAKITINGDSIEIVDLGSTNGTFVNGERISGTKSVKVGDRILIGTSILRVIGAGMSEDSLEPAQAKKLEMPPVVQNPGTSSMSGDLEDVPVPDLLQLFATTKKTGILEISNKQIGRIDIKNGQIQNTYISSDSNFKGLKALCRILTWTKGSFSFNAGIEGTLVADSVQQTVEGMLTEAIRLNDEFLRLLGSLPLASVLQLTTPLQAKLSALSAAELDALQLVINQGQVGKVLDLHPDPDAEVLVIIQKLIKLGYVKTP